VEIVWEIYGQRSSQEENNTWVEIGNRLRRWRKPGN